MMFERLSASLICGTVWPFSVGFASIYTLVGARRTLHHLFLGAASFPSTKVVERDISLLFLHWGIRGAGYCFGSVGEGKLGGGLAVWASLLAAFLTSHSTTVVLLHFTFTFLVPPLSSILFLLSSLFGPRLIHIPLYYFLFSSFFFIYLFFTFASSKEDCY